MGLVQGHSVHKKIPLAMLTSCVHSYPLLGYYSPPPPPPPPPPQRGERYSKYMAVGLWQEERDMLSLHHHRRGAGAITLHGSDRSESGQVAGADLDILVWGGCTVADPERYENPSTSRGVCPPRKFLILRQLLVLYLRQIFCLNCTRNFGG